MTEVPHTAPRGPIRLHPGVKLAFGFSALMLGTGGLLYQHASSAVIFDSWLAVAGIVWAFDAAWTRKTS